MHKDMNIKWAQFNIDYHHNGIYLKLNLCGYPNTCCLELIRFLISLDSVSRYRVCLSKQRTRIQYRQLAKMSEEM